MQCTPHLKTLSIFSLRSKLVTLLNKLVTNDGEIKLSGFNEDLQGHSLI